MRRTPTRVPSLQRTQARSVTFESRGSGAGYATRRTDWRRASWKHLLLLLVIVLTLLQALMSAPIPQSLSYHELSDDRTILSVPNCFDVLSNLGFLIVSILGLRVCYRSEWKKPSARIAWIASFAGIGLVSFGSAFYHWNPGSGRLVWDRLPMTIGFMGLFVALLGEHVNARLVTPLLPPALIVGIGSVVYWHFTDDLRIYYWVQTMPLLTIPVLLLLFGSRRKNRWPLMSALGCYVLAKLAEASDLRVWEQTGGMVSGHTLKHLLAAAGCYFLVQMLRPAQSDF